MGKEARRHRQKRESGLETFHGAVPRKLITLTVAREGVESTSTKAVTSFLRGFVLRHGLARLLRSGLPQYKGSRGFLVFMFSGYNTDRRELWEIGEVRDFVQALLQEFPLLLFLLAEQAEIAQGQRDQLLANGAGLFFLAGFEPVESAPGRRGADLSPRVFVEPLMAVAAAAIRQGIVEFGNLDSNLATALPDLVETKSERLFSQATGRTLLNAPQQRLHEALETTERMRKAASAVRFPALQRSPPVGYR